MKTIFTRSILFCTTSLLVSSALFAQASPVISYGHSRLTPAKGCVTGITAQQPAHKKNMDTINAGLVLVRIK